VFFDSVANTTEYTYTVFNDTFTSSTSNPQSPVLGSGIASFAVARRGNVGVIDSPGGWTGSNAAIAWEWFTSVPGVTSRQRTLGCNLPGAPVGYALVCCSRDMSGHLNETAVDLGVISMSFTEMRG